jgi:hypothetical protein
MLHDIAINAAMHMLEPAFKSVAAPWMCHPLQCYQTCVVCVTCPLPLQSKAQSWANKVCGSPSGCDVDPF